MRLFANLTCALPLVFALSASPASAAEDRPWVGDPVNGAKLYARECASCHGDDGAGGRSAVSMKDSGRLTSIRDEAMIELIKTGEGAKKPEEHSLGDKLRFLETWDVVAHVRSLHMELADFFGDSSRYVVKRYEIDKHGLKRIKKATGQDLDDPSAFVFTFFDFEGEEGHLKFVPQDPILLDHLNKKNKAGYLVFLPFESEGWSGEVGVAMDAAGVITRLAAHPGADKAELMNKSFSRFEGQGRKGQKEPFKVGGGKTVAKLSKDVFALYLRAMETVTMYDRDENERTWADSE